MFNTKRIASFGLAATMLASQASVAFAQNATTSTPSSVTPPPAAGASFPGVRHNDDDRDQDHDRRDFGHEQGKRRGHGMGQRNGEMQKDSSVAAKPVDLACVQTAVAKRETALSAGLDAYYTAVKAALDARKTALNAAWGTADATARKTAVQAAWTTFKAASTTQRRTIATTRKNAWTLFKAERSVCGGQDEVREGEKMDQGL